MGGIKSSLVCKIAEAYVCSLFLISKIHQLVSFCLHSLLSLVFYVQTILWSTKRVISFTQLSSVVCVCLHTQMYSLCFDLTSLVFFTDFRCFSCCLSLCMKCFYESAPGVLCLVAFVWVGLCPPPWYLALYSIRTHRPCGWGVRWKSPSAQEIKTLKRLLVSGPFTPSSSLHH